MKIYICICVFGNKVIVRSCEVWKIDVVGGGSKASCWKGRRRSG